MRDAAVRLRHVLGDLAAEADDLDRLVWPGGGGATRRNAAAIVEQIGVEVGVADAVAGRLHLARSMPRSRARARTAGEASTCAPSPVPFRRLRARPAGLGGGASAPSATVLDGDDRNLLAPALASARPRRRLAGALPCCRRRARQRDPRPRSRSPPAPSRSAPGRRLRRRARCTLPATGLSISTVALSVIMSASCWSSAIVSPTLTCQATISASAMPSPMSGSLNSKAGHQSAITFSRAFFMRFGPGK